MHYSVLQNRFYNLFFSLIENYLSNIVYFTLVECMEVLKDQRNTEVFVRSGRFFFVELVMNYFYSDSDV